MRGCISHLTFYTSNRRFLCAVLKSCLLCHPGMYVGDTALENWKSRPFLAPFRITIYADRLQYQQLSFISANWRACRLPLEATKPSWSNPRNTSWPPQTCPDLAGTPLQLTKRLYRQIRNLFSHQLSNRKSHKSWSWQKFPQIQASAMGRSTICLAFLKNSPRSKWPKKAVFRYLGFSDF